MVSARTSERALFGVSALIFAASAGDGFGATISVAKASAAAPVTICNQPLIIDPRPSGVGFGVGTGVGIGGSGVGTGVGTGEGTGSGVGTGAGTNGPGPTGTNGPGPGCGCKSPAGMITKFNFTMVEGFPDEFGPEGLPNAGMVGVPFGLALTAPFAG